VVSWAADEPGAGSEQPVSDRRGRGLLARDLRLAVQLSLHDKQPSTLRAAVDRDQPRHARSASDVGSHGITDVVTTTASPSGRADRDNSGGRGT